MINCWNVPVLTSLLPSGLFEVLFATVFRERLQCSNKAAKPQSVEAHFKRLVFGLDDELSPPEGAFFRFGVL